MVPTPEKIYEKFSYSSIRVSLILGKKIKCFQEIANQAISPTISLTSPRFMVMLNNLKYFLYPYLIISKMA